MTDAFSTSSGEPIRTLLDGRQYPVGDADIHELYRAQSGHLVARLAERTGCRETARDIAQEAFARFLRLSAVQRFRIERPEAYLQRISTNLLRDWGRGLSLQRAKLERLETDAPAHVDQVAILESRDTLRRLEVAMLKLKPRTRQIFMAHRLDGLSYAEIAELTGISVKGVEKQMSKAIAKIDRMLDRS